MEEYTDFGENCNLDVTEDRERITDYWACRISRSNHITFSFALAIVRANKIVTEARDD